MNYRQWSRRQFLQHTAGAAGASLAARSIWLEADPITALPRSAPPSDRVRFGIIGVGMEGTGLLSLPSNFLGSSAWQPVISMTAATSMQTQLLENRFI